MGQSSSGFTIVELLVVIGIIAVLMSILLPSLMKARRRAVTTANLSNLRQLGLAVQMYLIESQGYFPVGAWPAVANQPRVRWADAIFPFVGSTKVFMSPHLDEAERARMRKPFAHTCLDNGQVHGGTIYFGGYGYNYQYLGNGRAQAGAPSPYATPFLAKSGAARASTKTVLIADTQGSRDGYANGEGVYVIDPPLQSLNLGSRGSRKAPNSPPGTGNYGYRGGNDGSPPDSPMRAIPAARNDGLVAAVFCDGHAETISPAELDDSNKDGAPDNGYWNGLGNADPDMR